MKFSPCHEMLFLEPHRVTPAAARKAKQRSYVIITHVRNLRYQNGRDVLRLRRRIERYPRLASYVAVYVTPETPAAFQARVTKKVQDCTSAVRFAFGTVRGMVL